MNLHRLFNTELGKTFISIMLGLGLATLFKKSCNNDKCRIYKAPPLKKIEINSGAIIIAVVRKNQPYPNPEPEFLIMSGDMLILFGSHMQLDKSIEYLQKGPQ